jgi:hypothetical protein
VGGRRSVSRVQSDCAVDVDTNSYSVPWRLIGESVQVTVLAGRVVIRHAGQVVADHPLCRGRRQRITDTAHLAGVAGASGAVRREAVPRQPSALPPEPGLLRPLAEYERAAGGGW